MTRRAVTKQAYGKRELRSPREIGMMRKAGLLVWLAHQAAGKLIRPGTTTAEIDRAVTRVFAEANAEPLFLGYPGATPFPAATCISINEQVVHGIPGDRKLINGDLVSVDTGCRIQGWCGDAALTHPVGEITASRKKLLHQTHAALNLAIELCGREQTWSAVARQIQSRIESNGLHVIRDLVGHGIGRELHEAPSVANFFDPQIEDFSIRPGVVIAIEPMVGLGTGKTKTLSDQWTIITRDGKPSAHFEHTVAITADGPLRLTGPPSDEELEGCSFDPGPKQDWIVW